MKYTVLSQHIVVLATNDIGDMEKGLFNLNRNTVSEVFLHMHFEFLHADADGIRPGHFCI